MTRSNDGGGGRDVVDILTDDHREMVELLGEVQRTADASRRRALTDTVIAEVMRHAVAEEMYVYPAVEEKVPDGPRKVAHDKEEHQEIVELMKAIEDLDAAGPEFMERVKELDAELRHHAHDEETRQFPELRAHLSTDELSALGSKVEMAKKLAPTRPHPNAPHSELFHKTLGPGVGLVDRLRDALTGRHTE